MAKCKSCGEINPDNSRFCVRCGTPLGEGDNSAMKEALSKAQKDFDRDAMATLDKSRITYVCTVCGSINPIDQEKCSRCGKPRPRSEFVNALKRIKESDEYKAAPAALPVPEPVQEKPAEQPTEVAQQPVQQPIQQPIQQVIASPIAVAPMAMGGGGQANAITQPFVVVPYVNPIQPLWQYKPNQLYRYQAYTPEELAQIQATRDAEERAARAAAELEARKAEAAAKEAEAAILAEAEGMAAPIVTDDATPAPAKKKTKGVRVVAALTMLLSIALIAVAFLLPLFKSTGKHFFYYATGILPILKIDAVDTGYAYGGALTELIAPIAAVATLLLAVIIIIRAFVRLLTGNAKFKGWILPLLMFLTCATTYIGIMQNAGLLSLDGIKNTVNDYDLGLYIIVGLALVTFIVSLFSPKNKLAKASAKKAATEEKR